MQTLKLKKMPLKAVNNFFINSQILINYDKEIYLPDLWLRTRRY